MKIEREGLTRWKGMAKDSKGCSFPYECWQQRYRDANGEMITERIYACPWFHYQQFKTLEALKDDMSWR